MFFLIIGAYYYHYAEKGKNYEQTMLDVLSYAKQQEIPYRLELRMKKSVQIFSVLDIKGKAKS